jgi:hypothetical protein
MYLKTRILPFALILLMLLSGFSFFDQLKIMSIPLFQTLLVFVIFVLAIKSRIIYSPNNEIGIKYYSYFLWASLFPLVIGISSSPTAFLVYLYSIFPLMLFTLTYKSISIELFHRMLKVMNMSMLGVTILGWLLLLGVVDYAYIYNNNMQPEFNIGYWGIRYTESTRNSDYLYPLIGLAISTYFNINQKKNIFYSILIFIFIVSLLASLSRGAIVISVVLILINFSLSTKIQKIQSILIVTFLVLMNYGYIVDMFDSKYNAIIYSMSSFESTEGRFSNTGRMNILANSFLASIYNPVGYGINNYSSIYDIYNLDTRISNSAENAYVTILVERGWLSFIFFLMAFYKFFKRAYIASHITLNKILLPMLAIYFLFNYELNTVLACFIFYIVFLDYHLATIRGLN